MKKRVFTAAIVLVFGASNCTFAQGLGSKSVSSQAGIDAISSILK